jgi:hypothetical protein
MKTNIVSLIIVTCGLIVVSPHSGKAGTVQGFESGLPANSTIGDALVVGTYEGIAPPEGNNQLLLTTINNSPNSDPGISPLSGNNAVTVGSVAAFVGNGSSNVNSNTLRFNSTHTGREGSAFDITLSLQAGTVLTFQYDFLTAEDPTANPAHEDFGFATLVNSSGSLINYQILGHQTAATNSTGQSPFFSETGSTLNHFGTYQITITNTGTYTLGIGVMDGQTMDTPSALLVDNISTSTAIPEPSTTMLFVVGTVLGYSTIRKSHRPFCRQNGLLNGRVPAGINLPSTLS